MAETGVLGRTGGVGAPHFGTPDLRTAAPSIERARVRKKLKRAASIYQSDG